VFILTSFKFLCLGLCAFAVATVASAQELREQPTPFSTWLDFQTIGSAHAPRQALPIWLESVQKITEPVNSPSPQKTTVRIRLRRFGQLNNQLQVRLFFTDKPDANPVVTGWSETGTEQFRSLPLGDGLNLPTSETVIVPGQNLDYLDIATPGDGANLRGAFVATLKKSEILHALDFAEPAGIDDPFGNLPKADPADDDSFLYGRVKAAIDPGATTLSPTGTPELTWQFEIEAIPLLAVASLEILDADPLSPPEFIVNDRPLGPVAIRLPDLADPAYQATVRPLARDTRFQYNGWLRGQVAIPGGALRAGLNKIVLRLNSQSGPVAIRAVELQLKYHWQHLDYKLVP
jgi:hypothetical protein